MLTLSRSEFWDRVNVLGEDECWEWNGGRHPMGYGSMTGGKRAHRVAYELAIGPIPEGLNVCHHCDNPPCCNPSHLFIGTQRDNTLDAINKGRYKVLSGTLNGNTKLSENDVREIFLSKESFLTLAKKYVVSKGTIGHIKSGRTWKEVTDDLH